MSYLGLAALFLVPAAALAVVAARVRGLGPRWWVTTGVVVTVLLILTVVFDSVMVAADLFRYGDGALSGIRLWLAPLEDLAWPVAAALLLPALWELLRRRSADRAPTAAALDGEQR